MIDNHDLYLAQKRHFHTDVLHTIQWELFLNISSLYFFVGTQLPQVPTHFWNCNSLKLSFLFQRNIAVSGRSTSIMSSASASIWKLSGGLLQQRGFAKIIMVWSCLDHWPNWWMMNWYTGLMNIIQLQVIMIISYNSTIQRSFGKLFSLTRTW